MSDHDDERGGDGHQTDAPDAGDAERAVSSVPLETEDGDTVVIAQQNVGPGQQVGAGEFKRDDDTTVRKSPEQAADEQAQLDAELEGDERTGDDHEQ
jgi:hypothetical protein